jgi:hypothetical protein
MKATDKIQMEKLANRYRSIATDRNNFRNDLRNATCPAMLSVGENVLKAYEKNLSDLRAEWQVLENKRIAEHKKSAVSKFLNSTKGMDGQQILIALSKQSA